MSPKKSHLQSHFENILAIKNLVDRWSLNSHFIISQHINNINRALSDDQDFHFSKKFVEKELNQYAKSEDYQAYYLLKELYADEEFLKLNIPLSDKAKMDFVKRVANRCSELDTGYTYNTITVELNRYLAFLISQSPDITDEQLYGIYKDTMRSCLLGRSFRSIKNNLPKNQFEKLYHRITEIPLFKKEDFTYVVEVEDQIDV